MLLAGFGSFLHLIPTTHRPAPLATVCATEFQPGPAQERRLRAPELDDAVGYLNTGGRPIHLRDLRGKVVLLDFWCFCCINCMHVMPDLARLEKKYPKDLVVVGIHSAKFNTERNTHNIRKAIQRYEITHPVVNDANLKIWQAYNVQFWPTFVLIDPEGYVVGGISSEGRYAILDQTISKVITLARARKTLSERLLPFQRALQHKKSDSPLYFPGKSWQMPAVTACSSRTARTIV